MCKLQYKRHEQNNLFHCNGSRNWLPHCDGGLFHHGSPVKWWWLVHRQLQCSIQLFSIRKISKNPARFMLLCSHYCTSCWLWKRFVAGTASLALLLTDTSEELDTSCQTQRNWNSDWPNPCHTENAQRYDTDLSPHECELQEAAGDKESFIWWNLITTPPWPLTRVFPLQSLFPGYSCV